MKKLLLVLFFVTTATQYVVSQGFYAGLNAGLAMDAFPSKVATFYNVRNDNSKVEIQQPEFSLGGGFVTKLSLGYFFNEYIGFEAALGLNFGAKVKFHKVTMIMNTNENRDIDLYANSTRFIAYFVLKGGESLLTPYLKIGPMMGIINQKMDEHIKIDTNIGEKQWEYSGPVSLGVSTVAGINYKMNDNIGIGLSLTFENMVYRPTHLDLVYSSVNHFRNDDALSTFEKHIVFVDWSDDPYNAGPQDPDKPQQVQSQTFSHNNISLRLEFVYNF